MGFLKIPSLNLLILKEIHRPFPDFLKHNQSTFLKKLNQKTAIYLVTMISFSNWFYKLKFRRSLPNHQ